MTLLLVSTAFAQTTVESKKLGKTLEKNKDASAVFVSQIDLSSMSVAENGMITLPFFTKNKISIVSGMDMTSIKERIAHTRKATFAVTFITKGLKPNTYAITKIDGIESVSEYNARLAEEARIAEERRIAEEKRRAEEEKAQYEHERLENLTKMPIQVVNQEVINITGTEASWLPGQIQDKLKSNLQEYLGMKTVVDSNSEVALKKIQAQSESSAHDEKSAIEFGKITTAKFALFIKIRKTGKGYILNVDFTDLTTGEQLASITSKEYTNSEYLYGSTGAADEITLLLANKLKISISDLTKNMLANGSSSFTTDEQLALAKQNEEQYKKMMSQYDAELAKLSVSNDLSAIENKRKIEAEKALLAEKQNAERKRQEELKAQKEREQVEAKLEAERSIALKTQRDKMAKEAAAKAAEVRKLKRENQGILGQINVIESKKKALVEIRQRVEKRCNELFEQLEKDRANEEQKIRNKPYSTVELENGQPTEVAKERRENQVTKSNQDLTIKFFSECDAVKSSTQTQDKSLLAEIRADQKAFSKVRTVSSLGDELKVSFGKYEGSQNGWNAYLSLYSDGVLLYTDAFIVGYEALTGKKAPDMTTELRDSVIEEYTNTVDMYNSLLTRGDPIIYFELDYTANAESDDKPSEYNFNFDKIRVINTVNGKTVQTSTLGKVQQRTMKPEQDLREFAGIEIQEKARFDDEKYRVEFYMANGLRRAEAENAAEVDIAFANLAGKSKMVEIPNKNLLMLNTEVTQKLYREIMGDKTIDEENLSFKGENYPRSVTWYDTIYFCNKLSEKLGLVPVYDVGGETDTTKWHVYEYEGAKFLGSNIYQNLSANGFRLPTREEWQYAAEGGQHYKYAGSDNLDEVGWYNKNSGGSTHPVAEKKPNGYGLYDMSGNVWEWVWDSYYDGGYASKRKSYQCGGSIYFEENYYLFYSKPVADYCTVREYDTDWATNSAGFRIVRNSPTVKQ